MTDQRIREKIHHAVDACGAHLPDDPFLASRIIAATKRKEFPRMKKLSTGMIVAIVLMLLSATAVAAVLTIEDMWQLAFQKMGTTGEIRTIGTPTEKDLTMDEAAAIAREALKASFGVTDEELDAMGFYPSYFAAEVDDGIPYPSQWQFLWSSRTNVDIDKDDTDYGPNGEYRVYLYGETGEIDVCNFYTNNFWDYAQRVWDVGNQDLVYWHYQKTDFFNQTDEVQAYWTQQLADAGYTVRGKDEELHQVLRSAELDLLFCDLTRIADNDDPQVAAAWAALEETGLPADLLQKYAFVATIPGWNTGYDDVCIHFSYELEWDMMKASYLDQYSDWVFGLSNRLGMYMVSFEKGSTNVAAVTHVKRSETQPNSEYFGEGPLLVRTDWDAADLPVFDAEYATYDRAVKRMRAAGLTDTDIQVMARDYFRRMGVESEYYPAAPEEMNVLQWFAEESEWDAKITQPTMTYEEFAAQYGPDERFWPMEVMIARDPSTYRMPNEGETTFAEALQLALDQLASEYSVTDVSGYTINVQRVSLTADPAKVDCRWQVFIADNPRAPQKGWKIYFGEWDGHIDKPFIQDITDPSNG